MARTKPAGSPPRPPIAFPDGPLALAARVLVGRIGKVDRTAEKLAGGRRGVPTSPYMAVRLGPGLVASPDQPYFGAIRYAWPDGTMPWNLSWGVLVDPTIPAESTAGLC